MPLSTEQIPNRCLNGEEWKQELVRQFKAALDNDCLFSKQISYRRCAATITAKIQLVDPIASEHEVRVWNRAGSKVEDPPVEFEEEEAVVGFERKVEVDNPNLVRVVAGMPIEVIEKLPPKPGDIFPSFETRQIHYSKEDYPEPKPAVQTDTSEKVKAEFASQRKKK